MAQDRIKPIKASLARVTPAFSDCQWQVIEGAGLQIGTFACGPQHGHVHLVADAALPGFWLESQGAGGPGRSVAVRTFRKPAAEGLDAILPAVRAASPGAHTTSCVFAPAPGYDDHGRHRYVLAPTGAPLAAWLEHKDSDAPIPAPCGPLGVDVVGDRYFEVLPGAADTVVFVEMGSEIQIFDPATIKAAALRTASGG